MRRASLTLISAGLLLGGCVPPTPYGNPYAPQGYAPQPVVAAPGQAYIGPDGLTYVDGYPVDTIDGYQAQYVFLPALGGWGYYDNDHHWRGAPPGMRDRLERYHPAGRGLPPPRDFGGGGRPGSGYGGFQGRPMGAPNSPGGYQGRPGGYSNAPPGQPGGPRGGYQGRPGPGGPPPGAAMPAAAPGRPGPGGPPQGRPPQGRPPGPPQRPPPHNCPPGQPRC